MSDSHNRISDSQAEDEGRDSHNKISGVEDSKGSRVKIPEVGDGDKDSQSKIQYLKIQVLAYLLRSRFLKLPRLNLEILVIPCKIKVLENLSSEDPPNIENSKTEVEDSKSASSDRLDSLVKSPLPSPSPLGSLAPASGTVLGSSSPAADPTTCVGSLDIDSLLAACH